MMDVANTYEMSINLYQIWQYNPEEYVIVTWTQLIKHTHPVLPQPVPVPKDW